VKNGVVFQKIQSHEQVLTELRSLGVVTSPDLQDDWRTRRAAQRDLQVLVEIVNDICQRLLPFTIRLQPPPAGMPWNVAFNLVSCPMTLPAA
jgi:hypothetical protein